MMKFIHKYIHTHIRTRLGPINSLKRPKNFFVKTWKPLGNVHITGHVVVKYIILFSRINSNLNRRWKNILTFFFNKRIIYIFKAYRKYTQSSRILHFHQSRDISFQTMPLSRSHTKRSHTVYSRRHTNTSLDSIFTLQLIVSAVVASSFEQQQ